MAEGILILPPLFVGYGPLPTIYKTSYAPPMLKPPSPSTIEDKLNEILLHLRHLDSRDRLRTIGGFFRGLLGLIPIIVLLGSIWYVYKYGDQLLEKIAEQAAIQAEVVTKKGSDSLLNQFKGLIR